MILVHSTPTTLAKYRRPNLGVLSSPRCVYMDAHAQGFRWAADNDAYSAWDPDRYRRMLARIYGLPGCLFVTAPDVVGAGRETLRLFAEWYDELSACWQPVALVAQDGMRKADIPWRSIDAVFIGGTSEFKMGDEARSIAREARLRDLWLHMGRVNSHRRLMYAKAIGCDSIDGTSFSWWKTRWLDEFLTHAAGPTQGVLT